MEHSERLEIFERVRAEHSVFLISVLWKLTGDKELFTEAMQYTLMGMWQHVEKLAGKKAGAYIYRIALTANSRAWRNRIGRISGDSICPTRASSSRIRSRSEAEDNRVWGDIPCAASRLRASEKAVLIVFF